MRSRAVNVLAQGAVGAPRRNFGTRMNKGPSLASFRQCLDARIPRTIGLPRAVGPYTVIRTTRLVSTSAKFVMFCPFMDVPGTFGHKWFNWCGIESIDGAQDISGGINTRPISIPLTELGPASEVVPAAMTVQVMNPAALQHAFGVFAMARVNQQLQLGDSPAGLTYNEMANRVISFYSPRILTGGKLAVRGVKCDAYPLNMAEYANFAPVRELSSDFDWDFKKVPCALSPIVFIQQNDAGLSPPIDFMVTIEWRVRFDPINPATASHTYHDVTPDNTWNSLLKHMSSDFEPVEEIAEAVANIGKWGAHQLLSGLTA